MIDVIIFTLFGYFGYQWLTLYAYDFFIGHYGTKTNGEENTFDHDVQD